MGKQTHADASVPQILSYLRSDPEIYRNTGARVEGGKQRRGGRGEVKNHFPPIKQAPLEHQRVYQAVVILRSMKGPINCKACERDSLM